MCVCGCPLSLLYSGRDPLSRRWPRLCLAHGADSQHDPVHFCWAIWLQNAAEGPGNSGEWLEDTKATLSVIPPSLPSLSLPLSLPLPSLPRHFHLSPSVSLPSLPLPSLYSTFLLSLPHLPISLRRTGASSRLSTRAGVTIQSPLLLSAFWLKTTTMLQTLCRNLPTLR